MPGTQTDPQKLMRGWLEIGEILLRTTGKLIDLEVLSLLFKKKNFNAFGSDYGLLLRIIFLNL